MTRSGIFSMLFSGACTFCFPHSICGQERSDRTYDSLSLRDLLNIKIVSVSKKDESLFEAPLSASVVTRDDIARAGSTSVMEALRLVPGMIVREQSNGNYDIHLRGMDNVPPNAPFDVTSNTTTLVMIDNRPVYSYLRGGTFWETLPVDLNDVERIEVIRGPAAALYGPNAVNGVINIITRRPSKDGLYLVANAQQGSFLTNINNVSAGYRFNKKWDMTASGNWQGRDRTQLSYFEFNRNKYLTNPQYFLNFSGDTVKNIDNLYPDQPMAMEKYAGNLFIHFSPENKVHFSLSAGAQHSEVQKVSVENEVTPLSTAISGTRYADLRVMVKGLTAQLSYDGGIQSTANDPGRKYRFSIAGGNVEYSFVLGNLSLKPGLSYNSAVYDDRKYSDLVLQTGLINGIGQITTIGVSLRGEYKLADDKIRIAAGIATSTFNHPDTTYLSSQFAITYKLNRKNLVRFVYSRAPRSSNIFDTYVSKTISSFQTGINNYTRQTVEGDPNTRLLSAGMYELGYRGSLSRNLSIDVEAFAIKAENYTTPVSSRPYTMLSGVDTMLVIPVRSINLPLSLLQKGITIMLDYHVGNWQIRPFVTVQHTTAVDYAPFANTPDAGTPGAAANNIYSGLGSRSTLKSTPALFGGGWVNYTPARKWNINMNTYYYSSQIYYHVSNIVFNDGVRGIDHIAGKFILNATVSYEPSAGLHLFCSGKNILNDRSREFFRTDAVPAMVLGGIKYEFKN